MPTYEYVCSKCDKHFEVHQSIKDDALTTCPKDQCPRKPWAKGKIKRAVSAGAGLIFKGSGFYITDYRSEGYKAAAKKDAASTSSSSSSSSSASSSSSSTPAASKKPESKPKSSGTKSD